MNEYPSDRTVLVQQTETSLFMMSYVILTKSGNAVIIDGGRPEDLPLLRKIVGSRRVTAWFLTHPHLDHISGFTEIAANMNDPLLPDKVYYNFPSLAFAEEYDPDDAFTLREFLEIEPLIRNRAVLVHDGDCIQADELTVRILQSYEEDSPILAHPAGNENSLVFKIETGGKSVLFLGDTGPVGGDRLYERHWQDLKSDLVQMAHHGHSGVGAEVYMAIEPEACLWNCPDWLWEEAPLNFGPRLWGTVMTRKWMAYLGVKTHYVTKDGTHSIILD